MTSPHSEKTQSPVAVGDGSADSDESATTVTSAGIDVAAVEKVIEIMRPAIQADQGDIFLRAVDAETGIVSVELVGACVTCPISTATLKDGVERILKQRVAGVTGVQHVGAELAGAMADDGTPVGFGL